MTEVRSHQLLINDQRSMSCIEEREELARHNAWQLQKELFNTEGHDGDVEDTDFFKCYVPIKASVQGLAIHTQTRTYIVHSGASVHMLGIYSVSPKGDGQFESLDIFWTVRLGAGTRSQL